MTKSEIDAFIEAMEEIGDVWKPEDVKRVYGQSTLEEALTDRKSSVDMFFNIIGKVINR